MGGIFSSEDDESNIQCNGVSDLQTEVNSIKATLNAIKTKVDTMQPGGSQCDLTAINTKIDTLTAKECHICPSPSNLEDINTTLQALSTSSEKINRNVINSAGGLNKNINHMYNELGKFIIPSYSCYKSLVTDSTDEDEYSPFRSEPIIHPPEQFVNLGPHWKAVCDRSSTMSTIQTSINTNPPKALPWGFDIPSESLFIDGQHDDLVSCLDPRAGTTHCDQGLFPLTQLN